jgi:hypothetical protein
MDEENQDWQNRDTGESGDSASIFEDVVTLIDDGRTLVEAELAYQKTRLSYAGRRGRNAAIFGAIAAVLVVFALFGLVMGAILALTPRFGAWGATALVVGVLVVVAILCALAAASNARMIAKAFRDED